LQAASLLLYFGSDGLMSLFVVTALFGLVQGGIVPPTRFVGNITRLKAGPRWPGTLLDAGGHGDRWLDVRRIFDATLSYRAASSTALPGTW
jgi:hypothetical protein